MKNWLANLFNSRREATGAVQSPASGAAVPPDLLTLQKEAQSLRMELEARDQSVAQLQQEIERLRERQSHLVDQTVSSKVEAVFNDLAAPASQILTQADLLENQDKPVQARDVLAVARRMVRVMERYGVVFEGKVGEQAAFDPNRHTPLQASPSLQTGQAVTVRFAGVTYQGKIIYKAIVE